MVSHRSRILTLFGMAAEYGCFGPDDRFLAVAPMCHGAGMIFSLAPVFFGGSCEVMEKFDAEEVAVRLKAGSMTGFFGVPRISMPLMSLERALLERHRPDCLRTVISNAAALPQAMKQRLWLFRRRPAPRDLWLDGGGHRHEPPAGRSAAQATVRRPAVPGYARRDPPRGWHPVCADEVGELFSTSPYLFNG